jgi:membrane-associated phospholipid phosphatase
MTAPARILPPRALSGWRFEAYKWATGIAVGVAASVLYFTNGWSHRVRSTELLNTAWDRAIPFNLHAVWFYLPLYVGIFLIAVATTRDRRLYDRALLGILLVAAVGAVGHWLVPAAYPRPPVLPPYPNPSAAFLGWVQSIDPPGNVFPSLHVAFAIQLALILRVHRPRVGALLLVMAALLSLSTLFTKQHFIADVAGGLALGAAMAAWVLHPHGGLRGTAKESTQATPETR